MLIFSGLILVIVIVIELTMAHFGAPIEGIAAVGVVCISILLFSILSKLDDILDELSR